MIGIWSAHASTFLVVTAIASLVALALPLLFVPLTWARWLRWNIPTDTHLAIYFGRCLGAVACVLCGGALAAASMPAAQPFFFALMLATYALMVLVHLWGAYRRIQPITETVETVAWAVLFVVTLLFLPAT